MKKITLTLLIALFCFLNINAQNDTVPETDIFDMTLEQLMGLEISIASKIALTQKESPAIVSVVTKDEIQNSGARDLIDVLRLVPGIDFNGDVWGMVGISMNGNWGNNGKVLLMIDGQEQNEIAFSSLFFGNHYPVEIIKRIEIIRGPGSAIYGGFGELGVINIKLKKAKILMASK